MIFISGVISIVIQKNTFCINENQVIYFCPNCVNFLSEKDHFFLFLFFFDCPPATPSSCAHDYTMENLVSIKENLLCNILNTWEIMWINIAGQIARPHYWKKISLGAETEVFFILVVVKIMQNEISKFSGHFKFALISWHCFINFIGDCRLKKITGFIKKCPTSCLSKSITAELLLYLY